MTTATVVASGRVGWGRLGVAAAAVTAVYAPIFPGLVKEWIEFPNLSHGFAVPLIAAYLIWVRRDEIGSVAAAPSWWGAPLLVVGLGAYAIGWLGGETFLARVSLPVTLTGATLLLAGGAVTARILPAIVYLVFMIPLPWVTLKAVTDRMRTIDASVTAAILPWIGVPVWQEGFLLHLPNITLEVADVCSSVPAVASLLALGAAYGYTAGRSARIRVTLLAVAVPFGIGSNIVRIILTAAGAYYIGRIALDNVVHMWNGATVFLMTLLALVALDSALCRLWREAR